MLASVTEGSWRKGLEGLSRSILLECRHEAAHVRVGEKSVPRTSCLNLV
jgi:hypothetical protein